MLENKKRKENNVKKTYSNDENGENEDNNNIYNKEDEIKTLKINLKNLLIII